MSTSITTRQTAGTGATVKGSPLTNTEVDNNFIGLNQAVQPAGGTAGQILAKIDATNFNSQWVDNYAVQVKLPVKNATGATIPKGAVVYVSGATGANALISLAQASGDSTSATTVGFLESTLATGDTGLVVVTGVISGIDTSAATEGDPVWLSGTTAGGVLFGVANKPQAPTHIVYLGTVTRAHATVGEIQVHISNGWELDELHDVKITSKANNDTLFYNSAQGVWVNATPATARSNLGLVIGTNVQAWDADLDSIAGLSGTSGFLKKTAANTWSLDTSTYLTGNQTVTLSGDATGSGTTSITVTLANSGVSAGTYGSATNIPQIAVDAKGRITSVSNVAVSIPSGSLTFTGDVTGSGSTGSTTTLTLAASGVTAGTYTKVTVDAKGRVTVGASLSSSDVTTALGYTPYNSSNPSGYITSSALSSYLPLSGGTLTGTLTINNGGDLVLQAASGSSDPGDLVWRNGSGTELHRLWDGGDGLNYRYNSGTGYKLLHAGNYSAYSAFSGTISTALTSGTMISHGSMSDAFGWNSSYGTYIGSTVGGTKYLYANGSFYDGSANRTLLHTGNYTSYSMLRQDRVAGADLNSWYEPGSYGVRNDNVNRPGEWGGVLVARSADVIAQWYGDHDNNFWVRGGNPPGSGGGGTWNSWQKLLHSSNYSSYALPLSGGTVSGYVYLSANGQGVSGNSTLRVNGDITAARGNGTSGVIYLGNSGGTYLYYDGSNYYMPNGSLQVNGSWVVTASNYTSYSPSLTGSGASGTWGISISGTATYSNNLANVGYGNGTLSWYQTSGNHQTWSGGWASHIISNHGDGSNYYNQTIIMPFWGPPQYMRKEGGTNVGPWTFLTTENYTNYAASMSAGGVVLENNKTISSNYTMTSGKNGMCAGPITINSGVTVTIPTGSSWSIV